MVCLDNWGYIRHLCYHSLSLSMCGNPLFVNLQGADMDPRFALILLMSCLMLCSLSQPVVSCIGNGDLISGLPYMVRVGIVADAILSSVVVS